MSGDGRVEILNALASLLQLGFDATECFADFVGPRTADELRSEQVEPLLQRRPTPRLRQSLDAVCNFCQHRLRYAHVPAANSREPIDRRGLPLHEGREHVGIEDVFHRSIGRLERRRFETSASRSAAAFEVSASTLRSASRNSRDQASASPNSRSSARMISRFRLMPKALARRCAEANSRGGI